MRSIIVYLFCFISINTICAQEVQRCTNGMWGIYSKRGFWMVEPVYKELEKLGDFVLATKDMKKYALIDYKGNEILPPLYTKEWMLSLFNTDYFPQFRTFYNDYKLAYENALNSEDILYKAEEIYKKIALNKLTCFLKKPTNYSYKALAEYFEINSGFGLFYLDIPFDVVTMIPEISELYVKPKIELINGEIIVKKIKYTLPNGKEYFGNLDNTLEGYIARNLPTWEDFLSLNLKPIISYEEYLKNNIEPIINNWQKKGEFETTIKWQERVNEESRRIMIDELTEEYSNNYKNILAEYKATYKELVESYKLLYSKTVEKYYKQKEIVKKRRILSEGFELKSYDADNQSFLIISKSLGDILLSVPIEEAPSFKQNWKYIKSTISPQYKPFENDVVLASVVFKNNEKEYVYDGKAEVKYAVTDINYNFKPVEFSAPEISNIEYSFNPIEIIKSSVVQTKPTDEVTNKNIEIERKSFNATTLSDIDTDIPFYDKSYNEKNFAIIIANEEYIRESKVPYSLNDGEIFALYCKNTLGLPEQNVRLVKNATLNDMKYNLNWLKQVMDAYQGEARVIFYYAGYGIPDEAEKTAYLLPVDGYAGDVTTGYSLSNLYTMLGECPAKSVSVFLDACFSGAKREGDMLVAARGVVVKIKENVPRGNMVVFSASQGDETAYPYKEQQHGMFTYYLLKKLQESKGEATLGEIAEYVTDQVRKQSIVINGKMQTPTMIPSLMIGEKWKTWTLK